MEKVLKFKIDLGLSFVVHDLACLQISNDLLNWN